MGDFSGRVVTLTTLDLTRLVGVRDFLLVVPLAGWGGGEMFKSTSPRRAEVDGWGDGERAGVPGDRDPEELELSCLSDDFTGCFCLRGERPGLDWLPWSSVWS